MTIEFDGQNNKLGTTTADSVTIKTNDTDALTVDSSQKIGIGTSSPSFALSVSSTSSNTITAINTASNVSRFCFAENSTPSNTYTNIEGDARSSGYMAFRTNDTERLRIDSSGNVLVNTTNLGVGIGNTDSGHVLQSSGRAVHSYQSGSTAGFFSHGTDGALLNFYKSGVENGSITTLSGRIAIGTEDSGLFFNDTSNSIDPFNISTNSPSDNNLSLGLSNRRFDDAFITNGVTTGSDQNEKQQIALLSDAEINVAKRISQGFKTYKWNSAVEEKGDNARTHTGVIAQEVQQAFSDEGLDASNYGLFCSDTWWEKEISVDAVAEELDEEGNVIVEGKDAYTYIETKEEATEGYTERTRLGIRYPELLSFVSSAFEQRLTNIESRLEALENV